MDEERLKREALEGDWDAAETLLRERVRRGEPGILDGKVRLSTLELLLPSALKSKSLERLSMLYGHLFHAADRKAFLQRAENALGLWVKVAVSPEGELLASRDGGTLEIRRTMDGGLLRRISVEAYPHDCELMLSAGGAYALICLYFDAQSGSDWSEYYTYHIASGACALKGRLSEYDSIDFHRDGKHVRIDGYPKRESGGRVIPIPGRG